MVQPDKKKAFSEIYRVLKPGGRLAASDIALKQPLPKELWYSIPPIVPSAGNSPHTRNLLLNRNDLMAYVGCIGGAVLITEYIQQLKARISSSLS